MSRFTNNQLINSMSDEYINDIQLLQIIINERRAKLDMNNPLNTRLTLLAIRLDELKSFESLNNLRDAVIN
jgi:hypothetical protein